MKLVLWKLELLVKADTTATTEEDSAEDARIAGKQCLSKKFP
jgi:hypothetical protein